MTKENLQIMAEMLGHKYCIYPSVVKKIILKNGWDKCPRSILGLERRTLGELLLREVAAL